MDTTFMEKIVKRQKDNIDHIKTAGIVLAVLVIIYLSFNVQFLAAFIPVLVVGSIWGAWWLINGMNKEYEYSVTENFIDIDCITARRKRARAFSGDAKEFEICARMNTDYFLDYSKGSRKILNFAPTHDQNRNYFIVTRDNAKKSPTKGQTVLVVFEPDDRMIPNFKKYNPSKVKVDGKY